MCVSSKPILCNYYYLKQLILREKYITDNFFQKTKPTETPESDLQQPTTSMHQFSTTNYTVTV